jgi:hypothetical protein
MAIQKSCLVLPLAEWYKFSVTGESEEEGVTQDQQSSFVVFISMVTNVLWLGSASLQKGTSSTVGYLKIRGAETHFVADRIPYNLGRGEVL